MSGRFVLRSGFTHVTGSRGCPPLEDAAAARFSARFSDGFSSLSRRAVLGSASAAAAVVGGLGPRRPSSAAAFSPTLAGSSDPLNDDWWLGPDFWGNRLMDWVRRDGVLVCVAPPGKRRLCTVSVLTTRLVVGGARLSVRVSADIAGKGFAGFLIGTGTDAEHRRTAMVSTASGTGGGTLAVIGDDGKACFREHTNEVTQTAYAVLPAQQTVPTRRCRPGELITLSLEVIGAPDSSGITLLLVSVDAAGKELSRAVWEGAPPDVTQGGLALVSSGASATGPRWALRDLSVEGDAVRREPERALGPIVGTLFTVAGGVLKMTAQVFPFAPVESDMVTLEILGTEGEWAVVATAPVGAGYAATLRVEGWDATTATAYRVSHSRGGDPWSGSVPAEPTGDRPVRIATISCSKSSGRGIDFGSAVNGGLRGGDPVPLYDKANLWFPYEVALSAIAAQEPDLLVAMGDQYYEGSPTAKDPSTTPDLDLFYKYLQWLWAVRDLTRDRPTVVLVDDHDVYQGNLWGEGGIAAPGGKFRLGGFAEPAAFVNMVQRIQCSHNPDPIDPEPVAQGIGVYFTRFDYAGITFVVLEDRKFRTSANGVEGNAGAAHELLGPRQEAMLAQLVADKQDSDQPVVVITQTVFATVETSASGSILKTNGGTAFPKAARERALGYIKAAGGVMLSGDTHLATLVRHLGAVGEDGPMQFAGPALASSYQRWFTPAVTDSPPDALPYTGLAQDQTGAAFIVHAVANPRIEQADALERGTRSLSQRGLKSEGYGLVVIDSLARTYRFEAWPGDVDPLAEGAAPYPGWPHTLGFDEV